MTHPGDNEQVYAAGLLVRALDPASQPERIRALLRDEQELVEALVPEGARVVDLGSDTGRHLAAMAPRLRLGVGVDYERSYVEHAHQTARPAGIHYVVGDATRVPLGGVFDMALCLTGTWGTMSDKGAVLAEMRRLSPRDGSRLITVYTPESVDARSAWYARLGHRVVEVADGWLRTEAGFRSEHFTEERIRELVGPCRLHPLTGIAFVIQT